MAYRVAIVDDSIVDAAFEEDILKVWANNRQVVVQPERFDSAEKFLFRYADDKAWDILLLDIEMGAMDGVTMAKRVRQDNEAVQIVFITGYSDYIAEGYEVAALHYLMKPVNKDRHSQRHCPNSISIYNSCAGICWEADCSKPPHIYISFGSGHGPGQYPGRKVQ